MEAPGHFHAFPTPLGEIGVANSTASDVVYAADLQSLEEDQPIQRKFKSARLVGEYEKPWLEDRSYKKRERADKIILGVCAVIGVIIAAFICFTEWNKLPNHEYCLLLNDDFSNPTINSKYWSHEIEIGGFGYGSFDWTTDDPSNSYIDSQGLHIVPTLTEQTTNITANEILNGYTLNLTTAGTCTIPVVDQCSRYSNITNGTIINPVRSARLTTAGKVAIKYGKVEIVAKMPKGDWLMPLLWMYPENETYGAWPRSGEIDIAQSRGNAPASYSGGSDTVSSALHWGPAADLDQSARTTGKLTLRRKDLANEFHTYGIEWSEGYVFTWIDDRNYHMTSTGFGPSWGGNMYQRGGFPNMWIAGQLPVDVWAETGLYNTPFDQPFHLIMNVAVGASNGYFPDGEGDKPWIDGAQSSMRDFWYANNTWLPTWGVGDEKGLTVKSVKMWQEGKCG